MKLTKEDQIIWDKITKTIRSYHDPEHEYIHSPIYPANLQPLFNNMLDLHGLTLQSAHSIANYHIQESLSHNIKRVIHITGKSGQISKEYSDWMKQNVHIIRIVKLNDGGAWELWLK